MKIRVRTYFFLFSESSHMSPCFLDPSVFILYYPYLVKSSRDSVALRVVDR